MATPVCTKNFQLRFRKRRVRAAQLVFLNITQTSPVARNDIAQMIDSLPGERENPQRCGGESSTRHQASDGAS
jgi:hypothetical protein